MALFSVSKLTLALPPGGGARNKNTLIIAIKPNDNKLVSTLSQPGSMQALSTYNHSSELSRCQVCIGFRTENFKQQLSRRTMLMIPLECYASIPLFFLYNFLPNCLPIFLPTYLYDFIGDSLEIVGGMGYGMGYGICYWCL